MSLKLLFSLSLLKLIANVLALSPLSLTKPITDGFGVNIHFIRPLIGEIEMISSAGFKWVRMDMRWEVTEKTKGVYNFSEYEILTNALQKNNMSALLVLDYGNQLYGGNISLTTEDGRKAYAQWAAKAVEHFKGLGIIWEIYNEPNLDYFWFGKQDVHQYTDMAIQAVKAIRAKTPNEIIIGPAINRVNKVELEYLEECFKAGLLNHWDAVSVHPYKEREPETVTSEYNEIKKLIAKYAPKDKTIPIISGEWGYTSAGIGINDVNVKFAMNDSIQAKYLTRQFVTNCVNGVPVSIWYVWRNEGNNATDFESNFGVQHFQQYYDNAIAEFTPKESYYFVKTLSTVMKGYRYLKRLNTTDNANDWIVLFSDGNNFKLAVWTTIAQSHQVSIPSDKCDFELIDPKGVSSGKFSSDGGVVKFTVNDLVHYLVVYGSNHALENASEFKI